MKNYYCDSNSNKYQIVTEIKAGAVSGLSYLYLLSLPVWKYKVFNEKYICENH